MEAVPARAALAARMLKILAWLQMALCVLPLSLAYAFAAFLFGAHLIDANARTLRQFVEGGVSAVLVLLLLLGLVRLLRPMWEGRGARFIQVAAVVVLLVFTLPLGGTVIARGLEVLALLALAGIAWACWRGFAAWPLLAMAAALLLLVFVPTARLALPGAGLLALWLLALHIDTYTIDRIPPLVWFGLALGAYIALSGLAGERLRDGAWLVVLAKLYWSGAGALLCVATALLAVWMGRRALEEDVEEGLPEERRVGS